MTDEQHGVIEYRPALDGLRAWAVVAVVLYHSGATSSLPGLAPGGFLGVSVFFTLSGYLITTLLLRRSSAEGGLDVGLFWSRRVKRLVPVSLTIVLAVVLLAPAYWSAMTVGDAAAGIFGYTNWHVIASGESQLLRTIVGPLGPFWSLAVEEQFYVILSVVVVLAWRTSDPVRTLALAVGAGWIGSLAVQVVGPGPQFRLEFGTDSRGSELLAGCALALFLHRRPTFVAERRSVFAVAGPVAFLALVVLASTTDYDPPWLLRGGYAAVSVVSAVLVASLLADGPLTRMLATGGTVAIGRLSYSWYVVHWPVILVVGSEVDGLDRWPLVVLKIVASLAVAAALHVAVERPLRRRDVPRRIVAGAWVASTAVVLLVAVAVL